MQASILSIRPNTMSDIFVNLSITLDYKLKMLETSSLWDNLYIQIHFSASLLSGITKLALLLFYFNPAQPETFRL